MNQNINQQQDWNRDRCNEKDCKKEHCETNCSNKHDTHHYRSDAQFNNQGNTTSWTTTQETVKIDTCADKNCSKDHCQTNCDKSHQSHHYRQERETDPHCGDKSNYREYCETNCTKTHDYPHNYKSNNQSTQYGQQQGGIQATQFPTGPQYQRAEGFAGQQAGMGQNIQTDHITQGQIAQQGYSGQSGQVGQQHQTGYSGSSTSTGYSGQSGHLGQTGQTGLTGQQNYSGSGVQGDKIPHGPQLHQGQQDAGFVPKDTKVLHDQGLIDQKGQYVHNNEVSGDRH